MDYSTRTIISNLSPAEKKEVFNDLKREMDIKNGSIDPDVIAFADAKSKEATNKKMDLIIGKI